MPRSPSRDLADRFAGNRRYFRAFTSVEKWKIRLARLALLAFFGWLAWSYFADKLDYQNNHGPLAEPHAAWEQQCDACHRKGAGANWFDARGRWYDLSCEKCHAGPPHHASMKPEYATETCASCHHDHRGRDASLVKMKDDACERCHADLAKFTIGDQSKYANATNFATAHPEFKPLEKKHERHLKFSHSQHLVPGMTLFKDARGAWSLKDIPANQREKYRQPGQTDEAAVQLDCKACHTLDAAGKYYLPVTFEANCKACHPTTVPPTPTGKGTVVEPFDVPHGKPLSELKEMLEKEFGLRLQKDHPAIASPPAGAAKPDDAAKKSFLNDVNAAAAKAQETLVKVTCLKCHDTTDAVNTTPLSIEPPPPPEIASPKMTKLWLPSAKFDHTAHRAMSCTDCHPNSKAAYEGSRTVVNEREPVNILGIESCRVCHSPKGGIRDRCTDCHVFHGADHPRDRGAFAPKAMSIEEFLKGK